MSRTKAKVNTFIRLSTKSSDYTPDHLNMKTGDQSCDLCGQRIFYSFLLKYKGEVKKEENIESLTSDPDVEEEEESKRKEKKDLRVGSDCIITYVETSMPNLMQAMIEKMEMDMKALVDEHKAKVFLEKYPDFRKKLNELYTELLSQIRKTKSFELRSGPRSLSLFDTIKKADQDIRSNKYTTEPIAEEILTWHKKKELGELDVLFEEHFSLKSGKITLESQLLSEQENKDFFENHYSNYSVYLGWEKKGTEGSLALSKLEKYTFLKKEESYLRSMKLRKNKLIKNKDSINELMEKINSLFELTKTTDPEKESLTRYLTEKKPAFLLDEGFSIKLNFESRKHIFILVEKLNLSNLEKQFYSYRFFDLMFENEVFSSLNKSEYFITHYPEKIITRDKEVADLIIRLMKEDLIKRVSDIQEFIESKELVSMCFN